MGEDTITIQNPTRGAVVATRLTHSEKRLLENRAKATGQTVSQITRAAVMTYLEKGGAQHA